MVAIALPTTPALDRSRRVLPSGGSGRGTRPNLSLVPGPERTARPLAQVVAVALFALAVLAAGAYLVSTPTPAPGQTATTTYVPTEGDSMWSIAVATAPAGEAATYVEELVAANGGAEVVPGRAITLPAP